MSEPEELRFYEDRYYRDRSNLKHNLSFAGCGFLALYHVGVCCCMKKLAPHLYRNKPLSGTSAGAIAAVCLVCDVNIVECVQYMCELIKNARRYLLGPFDPRFRITEHLREGLNRILPSDAHVLCSGRLSISLTCFATYKNVVVNQFRSKEELITAVLCSTYIPIFSGYVPPIFRGQPVLDGGFSDNLLCIDKMTIRVSPFAGDADICPLDAPWDFGYTTPAPQHVEDVVGSISFLNNNIRLNLTNIRRLVCMVWPMSPKELANLACQGYEDARRYLITRGFIACRLHQTPRFFSTHGRCHTSADTITMAMTTTATTHRVRRTATTGCLNSGFVDPPRKGEMDGDAGSHSADRMPSPGLPYAPRLNRASMDSGLGWNVTQCSACQEELRKASQSKIPAFLVAIIMGDVKHQRQHSSTWSSLQLLSQGLELAKDSVRLSVSSLWWLGCRMFYLPLLLQLDCLICMAKMSIDRCSSSSPCLPLLRNLVDTLTYVRGYAANLDVSHSARLFDERFASHRPNARFIYPTKPPMHRSQPASLDRQDLATQLRAAILSGTSSFSDRLFCLHQTSLPNAQECGLEMFSTPTCSFFQQPGTANGDDKVADPSRPLIRSTSLPPSPNSCQSVGETQSDEAQSNLPPSALSPSEPYSSSASESESRFHEQFLKGTHHTNTSDHRPPEQSFNGPAFNMARN